MSKAMLKSANTAPIYLPQSISIFHLSRVFIRAVHVECHHHYHIKWPSFKVYLKNYIKKRKKEEEEGK